jgi:hypothetical protein
MFSGFSGIFGGSWFGNDCHKEIGYELGTVGLMPLIRVPAAVPTPRDQLKNLGITLDVKLVIE